MNNIKSVPASSALILVSHQSHNVHTVNLHLCSNGERNGAKRRTKAILPRCHKIPNLHDPYIQYYCTGCAAPEGECVYFSHILSNHVITVMFHTPVVELIVSIIVNYEVPVCDENQ